MKRTELLAPAGNYECFLAAIRAGADAVYLGGTKFGARAYADNFTEEEICRAIDFAHLWKRKVYLTLNTLLKENELEEVENYVRPLYERGLDGVIIQDFGVFQTLKELFPGLELHCSTQMTITGKYGAALAKEMGASRIVPARELSLEEIKVIRENVDIEIEAFIHGAMCYCYSGQCLFSSILGGRSGNRGKCAQPCRLPYKSDATQKGEVYPLSLKDMCTIDHIPELIEAGISSFKIEGRMKKAEYVAGVTGIYRKYIDLYYEKSGTRYSNNNWAYEWKIEEEDRKILNSLYIRSQVQDGYYFRHNGKEMVTLSQPGYSGNDEVVLEQIRNKYLVGKTQLPIQAFGAFLSEQPATLTLIAEDISVTVYGQNVAKAQSNPVTKEQIQRQIGKMGNTNFSCTDVWIEADENIFYPIKAINELRRTAVEKLQQEILKKNDNTAKNRQFINPKTDIISRTFHIGTNTEEIEADPEGKVWVQVRTLPQLQAVLENSGKEKLILESSLCKTKAEWEDVFSLLEKKSNDSSVYMAAPYIIRHQDEEFLKEFLELIDRKQVVGCLVRNLETYFFLKKNHYKKELIADANLYVFNTKSGEFWRNRGVKTTFPYELNKGEVKQLFSMGIKGIKNVYGRIPMMITANCIQKTMYGCQRKGTELSLIDRYRVSFPVITECKHCYNIIYNTAPLSLHKNYSKLSQAMDCKFVFTTENKEETKQVLLFFKKLSAGGEVPECPYGEYTTGHEKRGVE